MASPKKVTIRGKTYPSIRAAAMYLKCHESMIRYGIQTGRLETIGLDSGREWNPPVPHSFDGVLYPSQRAALKAVTEKHPDLTHYAKVKLLTRHGEGNKGKNLRKSNPNPVRGKPVTIRGKTYRSASQAAREMGLHVSTINLARQEGRLDSVGLPRRQDFGRVPVVIRGVHYPSVTQAARHLGVSPSCVSAALDRGTIDNVGVSPHRRVARPHRFKGELYPSRSAAVKEARKYFPNLPAPQIWQLLEPVKEDAA